MSCRLLTDGHKTTDHCCQEQDAIDLTDNDIVLLANLPLNPRLNTLLLARNRIVAIAPDLAQSIGAGRSSCSFSLSLSVGWRPVVCMLHSL